MSGDPADIRAWQRLDAATTTSGRLEPHDPERLAAIGVKRVINLALADHPEALADEGERLAGLGIDYVHIPVPFDAPDASHFAAFQAAVDGAGGPVHVHCIMNWRVSAFFHRRNMAAGMAPEQADTLLAQQWDPRTSDDPRAAVWARFISPTE